ncbi:MAG: hypothetical protein V7723_14065 [Sneathiella sp.]|uniref:hypothetical protein n=1 Tax=Sneathiella sp. TaxID=1964365 RepID=UPI0030032C41
MENVQFDQEMRGKMTEGGDLCCGIWIKAMAASELEPDDADRFDYEGQCIAVYN